MKSEPLLPNTAWFIPNASQQLPLHIAQWLLDQDSMTHRLQQHSTRLQIDLLFEGYVAFAATDNEISGLPTDSHQFWLREIQMVCDHKPWLYCRVVAPRMTAEDPMLNLKKLGNVPLGQRLFNQADKPRREGLQLAMIPWPSAALSPLSILNRDLALSHLWARRSRLCWQQHVLGITEIFLPDAAVYSLNQQLT